MLLLNKMDTFDTFRSKETFMPDISGVILKPVSANEPKVEKAKKRKKKARCFICNTKVGLLGHRCECNSDIQFCAAHRLPESHCCTFDFKAKGKELLSNKLVKVGRDKISKI
tara:strand:+ start:83 stop:418 length:336 start_codon:yes stop_codon:yes gene_type:complete